jgi:hypothetical protein
MFPKITLYRFATVVIWLLWGAIEFLALQRAHWLRRKSG